MSVYVRRYGRPDPLLERLFDISATVRMASVRYLHTMRFLKEILAFLSHFPQLIDALQRMKAKTQGMLVRGGGAEGERVGYSLVGQTCAGFSLPRTITNSLSRETRWV